jgi:acetyl-CoA synthetase
MVKISFTNDTILLWKLKFFFRFPFLSHNTGRLVMNSTQNSTNIESLLNEKRVISPQEPFRSSAKIASLEAYESLYRQSIQDPDMFWGTQAKELLSWFSDWTSVIEYDWNTIGTREEPYLRFFNGGSLNASYNCLDRHILNGKQDKTAILWQGEDLSEERSLSYKELHEKVCQCAHALHGMGIKKGDRVTIYMPMVPEIVISVLACARIGAIHSVVFSAFSPEALANRILDADSRFIITANTSIHAGKVISLKANVDEALKQCPNVAHVLVYKRTNESTSMKKNRDLWWHDLCDHAPLEYTPEVMGSEDPLFILYTSGSTGKPKGVLHTTAGYLLYTTATFKYVFDIKENDIFWCTADVGWITGHSYLIYGPLSNGATCVMFEGVPNYPTPDRFWNTIEKYKVSIFYTAPTAIRALMKLGNRYPDSADLSSLRLLGTVGEPINPEAWMWYFTVIGKEKCPVVDTWWQTETGGIMITTLPGCHSMKPGAAGKPFFGIAPKILTTDGKEASVNEGGSLVITQPWPGMLRGVYGDKTNELIKNVYFSAFPGNYFSADGARIDEDGYYWLLGRMDDVINVSGHRLATAEIESALVSHSAVAEAAVVGTPHEIKGQAIYCYVSLKDGNSPSIELAKSLRAHVREEISPIASPEHIHFTPHLPKTRSGKIMRRILRKIAEGNTDQLGDISTLADPSVIKALIESKPTS